MCVCVCVCVCVVLIISIQINRYFAFNCLALRIKNWNIMKECCMLTFTRAFSKMFQICKQENSGTGDVIERRKENPEGMHRHNKKFYIHRYPQT